MPQLSGSRPCPPCKHRHALSGPRADQRPLRRRRLHLGNQCPQVWAAASGWVQAVSGLVTHRYGQHDIHQKRATALMMIRLKQHDIHQNQRACAQVGHEQHHGHWQPGTHPHTHTHTLHAHARQSDRHGCPGEDPWPPGNTKTLQSPASVCSGVRARPSTPSGQRLSFTRWPNAGSHSLAKGCASRLLHLRSLSNNAYAESISSFAESCPLACPLSTPTQPMPFGSPPRAHAMSWRCPQSPARNALALRPCAPLLGALGSLAA